MAIQAFPSIRGTMLLSVLALQLAAPRFSSAVASASEPECKAGGMSLLALRSVRSRTLGTTAGVVLGENVTPGSEAYNGDPDMLPVEAKEQIISDGWIDSDGDDDDEDQDDGDNIAEVAIDEGNQRSLLSRRTLADNKRDCSGCLCLVESAALCGTSVVTDAAICGVKIITDPKLCGTKQVTDAVLCGVDIFKSCKWSRRRRVGKLSCDFKKSAKSCTISTECPGPKSCPVANKCNVASKFSDCFSEISSKVSGASKSLVKLITDTGCNSPSSCRDRILDGLEDAWELLRDELHDQANQAVSGVLSSSALSKVKSIYRTVKTSGVAAATALTNISLQIADYFSGHYGSFTKYNFGSVCSADGSGIWYMEPTDCDLFDEMAEIFDDLPNAISHVSGTVNKLEKCITMTGLLKVPTPFLELQVESFCIPEALLTPLEYFLGAMLYAGNVAEQITNNLKNVFSSLNNLVNSLNLMQIGRSISDQKHRREGADPALLEAQRAAADCAVGNDWALTLYAGVTFDGKRFVRLATGFEFSMGIMVGCKNGQVIPPNWVLGIQLAFGAFLPRLDASTVWEMSGTLILGLRWQKDYVDFKNRAYVAAGLVIVPEVEVAESFSLGMPIEFLLLPDELPSGFDVSIKPAVEPAAMLQQAGQNTAAASLAALEAAPGANTATGPTVAMTAAVAALARSEAFAAALAPRPGWLDAAHSNALLQSSLELERKGVQLVEGSLQRASKKLSGRKSHDMPSAASYAQKDAAVPAKFEIQVAAALSVTVCITPITCFGM